MFEILLLLLVGAQDLAQEAHDDVHSDCEVDVNDRVGGHGHDHGPLPSKISQVAWMVLMGDGIHNFGDGIAIGKIRSQDFLPLHYCTNTN